MRSHLIPFVALGLLTVVPASVAASDRESALALVNQAIKAHGGEDALKKAQVAVRSGKGVMSPAGNDLPFTDELVVHLPERMRLSVEIGPQKTKLLFVVNGDRGWQTTGGAVAEMSKERLQELREEAHVLWAATLVPLKKDFDLAPLPDAEVSGRPAAGVKAARKGFTELKLYFDKKSNLLVKIERRAIQAGLSVDKEYFFSDHKATDGVLMPTKQIETLNRQKFAETSSVTYKFLSKPDDSAFARP